MDIKIENGLRIEFKNILSDLSRSQTLLKDPSIKENYYNRLEELYSNKNGGEKFRHFYSDIFTVLVQIQKSKTGNIEILGQNLDIIKNGYTEYFDENNGLIDISDSINKLYDHVNLDIARLTYSMSTNQEIISEGVIRDIQSKVTDLQKNIQQTESNLQETNNKIKNTQKEYIAILGIFSAIVLAFTGGITFSTSVLENLHKVSVYRIIIVSLLIGLVLIDILFALFYYMNKLVNGNKSRITHPIIIIINIFIIVSILLTSLAWSLGLVEQRNKRIDSKEVTSSQSVVFNHEKTTIEQTKK